MSVSIEDRGPVRIVTIDRPAARNAVDGPTAQALFDAFVAFDADDALAVAVLTGADGTFCAGADLKAVATERGNKITGLGPDDIVGSIGPMGPTRLLLDKPVIAAVEGYAVAGGLELAVWCDLRVMAADASFGVFCRRWGVPLVDGGTIRLTRLIGHSRALDLILTGREIDAAEAERWAWPIGSSSGAALDEAVTLAEQLAALPQMCLRADRRSSYEQWSMDLGDALANEAALGRAVVRSGETTAAPDGSPPEPVVMALPYRSERAVRGESARRPGVATS